MKDKFNKITEKDCFDEIYAIVVGLITLLGWGINTILGMSILLVIAIVTILLTNDLKYTVPNIIFLIFCINTGFKNSEVPIPIMIIMVIFIVILVLYLIKNKIKISRMKSTIGLLGMAIINIIPIFWANNIPKGNEVFYFFFFTNLGYFIIYIILVNGIHKDSMNLLVHSMTYLGLVLSIECACKVIELKDTVDNILSLWYYMGWGLCNEAGIMICLSLPFAFYQLGKSKNWSQILVSLLKIGIMGIGILLTTSRGAFLFGGLEILASLIVLLFYAQNKKLYRRVMIILSSIFVVACLICIKPIIGFVGDIIENIFYNGFSDNLRFHKWTQAYQQWILNPRNFIFGPGFTCVIENTDTSLGYQLGVIVFHSTIMETIAIGGMIGLVFLFIHFYEKYIALYRQGDKLFFIMISIGFIGVDLYGLIDNTYHMYYFMIPLMSIMAVLDAHNCTLNNEGIKINL